MSRFNDNISERLDVELMLSGDRYPVAVGPELRRTGWRGGLWVRYVTPNNPLQIFEVERSNGVEATGFLLFGSGDFSPFGVPGQRYNWTSYDPRSVFAAPSGTNVVTMVNGGSRALFKVFETVSLDIAGVRIGPPITYNLNDPLKISENGLLCNDPDARLLLATGGAEVLVPGFCNSIPNDLNGNRLGLDLKY